MDIDEAQKELILAKQENQAVLDTLSKTKGWLTAREEAAALISAAAIMKEKNDAEQAEVQPLHTQRLDVAKNFMSSIEQARAETVGMILPEMILSTGACLKNAKVQSLDQTMALIQHSQGVTKVDTSALPAEMLDRLRFGFSPGGIGSLSNSDMNNNKSLATSASDRLVKMGANGAAPPPKTSDETALPPAATLSSAPVAPAVAAQPASTSGEPSRSSLGRVYTPGKGWQRMGANNYVMPAPSDSKSKSGGENPESVSKVKSRFSNESSNK